MVALKICDDFDVRSSSPSRWLLWLSLAVAMVFGLVLMCAAVLYVWLYIQQVQNGYKLARLSEEYERIVTIQRKLRLESSHMENPVHLEDLGRDQFGLAPPGQAQLFIMQ